MRTTRRFERALCVLAFALASSGALAADQPISEAAKQHFVAGVNLLRDPEGARYEEAYREFKTAYAATPSYKILGNIGLCAMKLERDGEAIDAYSKYLEQAADLTAAEKKQIVTDLSTLKSGVVRAVVTVSVEGAMLTDVRVTSKGERITNQYGPVTGTLDLGMRPGHHLVTAKASGVDDQTWEFDVSPGGKEAHTFTMKSASSGVAPSVTPVAPPPTTAAVPPPPPPVSAPTEKVRPTPTGVYVGYGVTGVLVVGGAVTGVLALGKKRAPSSKPRSIPSSMTRNSNSSLATSSIPNHKAAPVLVRV